MTAELSSFSKTPLRHFSENNPSPPFSGDYVIRLRDLSKIYHAGMAEPVYALRTISLDIERGSFVCIVGKSGSGKSTLLNLIGGLDTPSLGEIEVNGARISGMNRQQLAGYRRRDVGVVFQFFNLIPNLSAKENAALPLFFDGVSESVRLQRAEDVLTKVGLGHRLDHFPTELSGGEQQRTAIARALIHQPQFLLADEPTGNLDSATTEEIITLLKTLNRNGMTVLMITHDYQLAELLSTRIVTLKDGSLIRDVWLQPAQ